MTGPSQPHPDVRQADLERIVRRDFPADRETEVLAMLNEYGHEEWHRERERVRAAILKPGTNAGASSTPTGSNTRTGL